MADIIPIKAWRYNQGLSKDISRLTSPLFDVVSEEERNQLYANPLNSIHVSAPKEASPFLQTVETLNLWKEKNILVQDPLPGIYVYYQYFKLSGDDKEYCRKGFVCNMRVYDWKENILLRHENTIPSAVNDRVQLLQETQLQVSPTHGLYSDKEFELERFMDESISNPLYAIEDYQGVRDVIGVIHDKKVIEIFQKKLNGLQIILADGHHRYESALINKHKSILENPNHTGQEGYNFHFIYLTNIESEDLKILPTHRIVQNLERFSEEEFVDALKGYFHIQPIERNFDRINKSIEKYKWMFGLVLKNYTFLIQLKEESFPSLDWNFPEKIKHLDLTILHFFIIEKLLGIKGKDQRKTEKVIYERNTAVCGSMVETGVADMAILTKSVTIEEIKEVCYSGYTLPQKSTYFYPKVISGLIFNSIKENEFTLRDSCF